MTAELAGRNQRVQRMRRLVRDRDLRRAEHRYVVEGPMLVHQAIRAGLRVEQLLVPVSAAGHEIVEIAEAAGVPCGFVDDRVFDGISSTRAARPARAGVADHEVGIGAWGRSAGRRVGTGGRAGQSGCALPACNEPPAGESTPDAA